MSLATWGSVVGTELFDFAVGSWEARHSLFAHCALYGALLAAIGIAAAPLPRRGREWVLVGLSAASLVILGSAGMAALAIVYSLCLHAVVERVPGRAGQALAWLLLLVLASYPALLPDDIFTGNTSFLGEFWSFATNVWWLRCVAYVVDRRNGRAPQRPLREFLLATLFFPTFVNGPIETTEQLAAHRRKGPAVDSWSELRAYAALTVRSALRLALGMVKVLLATFYLSQLNETIFATSGGAVSHPRLWLWPIELYFTFYVVFSGWTDMALALARPLGFDVAENFDRPWRSRSVAEFWRRWHITFGVWLRTYVYVPLGGNRRHATRNVLLTFLASGLWHVWGALKVIGLDSYPPGAWIGFIVWGLMNGLGIVAGRWWTSERRLEPVRTALREHVPGLLRHRAAQAMAFTFVALAWIPFFLPPWIELAACWRILKRMLFLA